MAGTSSAAPFAYITNEQGSSVSVVDIATNTIVATVPVGTFPFGVAVNSTGTRVCVARGGGDPVVIDTTTNTVTTIPAGSATGVAINPAGTRVYVANAESHTLSVVDTATNTVVATISGFARPIAFGIFIAGAASTASIPTLSEWGTMLLVLSLLATGTWYIAGRRRTRRAELRP